MQRELLSACRCTSCKQTCIVLTLAFFQQFKYALIVKVSIIVVHTQRIAAVVIDDIGRDSFAEVGLKGFDALLYQRTQFILEPTVRIRIREIHDTHTRLPFIPLPDITVRSL